MKFFHGLLAVAFLAAALRLSTLVTSAPASPGVWTWKKLALQLPQSIEVYEGVARGPRDELFRAWRVEVEYSDPNLKATARLSDAPSGRELPSAWGRKTGALVAVNGGYFDMSGSPAKTYSLVVDEGQVLCPTIEKVTRGGKKYFVTRSAFGIDAKRNFEIAWVGNRNGKTLKFDAPILKQVQSSDTLDTEYSRAKEWTPQTAIGAGPRLIKDGKIHITFEDELFPGSGFQRDVNYPRCAIGFTAKNKLIILTTGYKTGEATYGLTLPQLAQTLKDLGCVEAMNLDGGGSELLSVNGVLLNRPNDGTEREVTSIFAIVRAE